MFLYTTDTARLAILSVACGVQNDDIKSMIRSHFQSDVEVDGLVLHCFAHGGAEITEDMLIAWMLLSQEERDVWIDAALRQQTIEKLVKELVEEDPGMDDAEALEEAMESYEELGVEARRLMKEEMREKRPFIQLGHPPEDGRVVERGVYFY